ncbi:MAG TPA: LacI family DNA-binding transcriptional regulator [Solirubrobacteraceae bacterium]|nr:LacI family DNA-binding transcriptional regulator [Solirubrobacteraceae bacterium]
MDAEPKRVGIRDIAASCGLSITTVSHALSGRRPVPAETRERVLRTAAELGYQPNPQARALRLGRSLTLAVQMAGAGGDAVLPDAAYFVDLLNGAAAEALHQGYALLLVPTAAPDRQMRRLHIDGAIVVDPTGNEGLLRSGAVPVVTTGRVPGAGSGDVPWVDNDFRAGTTLVLDHLLATGRRRPALIAGSPRQSYVADAIGAFAAWCHARDLEPRIVHVDGPATDAAGAAAARELLASGDRPDAVHATLDRLAIGIAGAALSMGLRIPEDLAVTAGSDAPALAFHRPPITALDLNPGDVGREAVAALIRRLEDRDDEQPRCVTVDTALVVRESTGPPGSARADG